MIASDKAEFWLMEIQIIYYCIWKANGSNLCNFRHAALLWRFSKFNRWVSRYVLICCNQLWLLLIFIFTGFCILYLLSYLFVRALFPNTTFNIISVLKILAYSRSKESVKYELVNWRLVISNFSMYFNKH